MTDTLIKTDLGPLKDEFGLPDVLLEDRCYDAMRQAMTVFVHTAVTVYSVSEVAKIDFWTKSPNSGLIFFSHQEDDNKSDIEGFKRFINEISFRKEFFGRISMLESEEGVAISFDTPALLSCLKSILEDDDIYDQSTVEDEIDGLLAYNELLAMPVTKNQIN